MTVTVLSGQLRLAVQQDPDGDSVVLPQAAT